MTVSLRDHSYYRTGGTCEQLHAPRSVEELAEVVKAILADGRPYVLLGGGTNSLVSDEHFPGHVIVFSGLDHRELEGDTLVAGAGVENSAVAAIALKNELGGAAWMHRLPGQLGGTVRMNARCYGGEISQIVTRVTTVNAKGAIKEYTDPKMFKGYKDTIFMKNGDLVAEVEIVLQPGADKAALKATMDKCESDRDSKGHFDFPSCGCVFKNDYKIGVSSGILLDAAGAKELKKGGAEVNQRHANFVFNKENATSRDILEISFAMQELVFEKFGAWLEYEMEVLGVLPEDLATRFAQKKKHKLNDELLAPLRAKMPKA